MRFEVSYALSNLDERIPDFFRQEIFAHGSLKVRADAIKILQSLEPRQGATHRLKMLFR